jgi:hypothetical protein
MVADLLLEASREYERSGPSAAAHAAHAVSECFDVLSKLTTGVDVNVKFHSVHAFEPTREVAVFDLLGISLVHGWLVDPEDAATAAAFGTRSYNEAVELLLGAPGGDEAAARGASGSAPGPSPPEAAAAAAAAVAAAAAADQQDQRQGEPPSSSVAGSTALDTMGAELEKLAAATRGMQLDQRPQRDEDVVDSVLSGLLTDVCQGLEPGPAPLAAAASGAGAPAPPADPAPVPAPAPAVAAPTPPPQSARDAAAVRAFLDQNCSQLTAAGLASLASELREHQLAVFFRNNHFSTAFKQEGGVYLLVTDLGYAGEPDVVWERLDALDGDTTLCTAEFAEFVPHAEPAYSPEEFEAAHRAAADAAAAERVGGRGADAVAQEDVDFALALQLQLAEEEALAAARARQQEAAAGAAGGQQQQQQQQQQQSHRSADAERAMRRQQQQEQQQQQHGRYPRGSAHGPRAQQGPTMAQQAQAGLDAAAARLRPMAEKAEKCTIM